MEEISILLAAGEGILLLFTMRNARRLKKMETMLQKEAPCSQMEPEKNIPCAAECAKIQEQPTFFEEENAKEELIDEVLGEIFS